jgi:putative transposase
LRAKRKGNAGKSWYCDESYVNIAGQGHYRYRAINRDGQRVDSMLSATRAMDAAKRFCQGAKEVPDC